MMEERPSKPWLAAKRYGYGSSWPIAWQGWLAVVLLVVAVGAITVGLSGISRFFAICVAVAVFGAVCALKTEGGWKWRSGDGR
jgi:hypothetical protein